MYQVFLFIAIVLNISVFAKNIELTKSELRFCVDPNWLPYEAIDAQGNLKGMSADLKILFEKKLHQKLVLYPTKTWAESLQSIQNKQCDMMPLVRDTSERRNYLDFTKPYIEFPYVIATIAGASKIENIQSSLEKTYAVTKGYAVVPYLKKRYPSIKLHEVKGIDQGIELLREKKVDGYIDSTVTLGYYISKQGALDIKINSDLDFKSELSIATRKDMPKLHQTMQTMLNSIQDKELEEIKNRWIHVQYESPKENQNIHIGLYISVALFIIALIAILKFFTKDFEYIKNRKDPFSFRRDLFLHHLVFSIIVSATVAPIFYMIKLEVLAVILNFFTMIAITLLVILRRVRAFAAISRVFIIAIIILFTSGLFYADQEINVLFFLLIFPIFAFSVRGVKEGFFWVTLFLVILLSGYFFFKTDDYNPFSFLFFIISYIMITYHYYNYRFFEIKFFDQHQDIQEKKDQLLLQQAKYANMGEMLGAIIHQWRQPLSEISSNVIQIQVQNEYKEKPDKVVVKESVEDINTLLLLMSKTLDSFQLVYKRDTAFENFFFPEAIEDTVSVFKSVVRDVAIALNYDDSKEKEYYIAGIKEDIFNIFLILLRNSQDAFSNSEKNKTVTIDLKSDAKYIFIRYEDNAGGISVEPIEKVFEQNITSKKSGMGIGLYIVKKLITQRYMGAIEVQNTKEGVMFNFSLRKDLHRKGSSPLPEHF